MKFYAFLPLALLVAAVFPLVSQEFPDTDEPDESETVLQTDPLVQNLPPDEDLLYVISDFVFNIKGRTRPFSLIHYGEFKKGVKIQGQANLDEYIREKTQLLINQRVLEDNVVITYSVGEQNEDLSYPLTLVVNVEDSWNIIAMPIPQYKSDTGFEFIIKARDYNFLGTMNPLRIDLGYVYDEYDHGIFKFGVLSDTPFQAFGYRWNFKFNSAFWYRKDVEEPFYYQNITGISMELPFRTTTFTFGFEEYFTLNEETPYRYKDFYKNEIDDFQQGLYMTSRLYILWEIPTGFTVSRYGELTYTPEISAKFNHELPGWPLLNYNKGPFPGFGHTLEFGKIDWYGNYRSGFSFSVNNSYTYDIFRLKNNEEPLSVSILAGGEGHFIISDFFGISSRLLYRHWFYHDPDYYEEAGDTLRGIWDRAIRAGYMVSLNMDFPFRIFRFTPSKWFNSKKAGFFDFEFHFSPVIDLALYHDPENNKSFHPGNIITSGGFELIAFSGLMRNLFIRLCLAWNLNKMFMDRPFKLPKDDNREISLTIGHFY